LYFKKEGEKNRLPKSAPAFRA